MRVLMNPHPSTAAGKPDGLSRVVENYGRYLPQFSVEIVLPDATSYDLLAAHAGVGKDATDVSHLHGLWWTGDMEKPSPDYFHGNAQIVQSLIAAKQVTVPSRWVAEAIARDMHFLPHVVPHGIDWQEWQHDEEPGGYVLWNKNRNTDVCDPREMAWIASRCPHTTFLSTFAPPDAPINVKVTGVMAHAEMKQYIQRASVYLSTTKETFGIGILEAMASGVPVLSISRGGALDIIKHRQTGYLATSWDDMVEGLNYCFLHRKELGDAAREAVKAYSWEKTCAQVAGIYEQALQPSPPFVTIVIPCYNYAEAVTRAIQSIKLQTWTQWECIVVNDGSTDNSEAAIQASISNDPRFRYVKLSNSGVAVARNMGMALGKGKYGCCLDADDQIAPTFLETCVNALESDRLLGIAYTSLTTVKADGAVEVSPWPGDFDISEQFLGHNQIPTCCVFRMQAWTRIGGQRQRYAPQGAGEEDAEGWARMNAIGFDAKHVTTEPLFFYSYLTGLVSRQRKFRPTHYMAWHPWAKDGIHPFASVAKPVLASHPVYQRDEPKISVIIPVGPGHERIILDALDSVEAQTFRDWEVIVVNDTGKSLQVLSAYPYVKLIETKGKQGAGHARNRGIKAMRSKLFVCLDADDILQPTYLQETFDAILNDPESWVYPSMYVVHQDGKVENYHCKDWNASNLWNGGVASVTCLYTKEMWQKTGGFDETHNREDWDFHLRLTMAGYCGVKLDKFLFTYRHATGERRGDGVADDVLSWIKAEYNLEALEEMCKGCSKKKNPKKSDSIPDLPANWASKEDLNWPQLEYVGNNQNDLMFKGRTGRKYYFGNSDRRRFGRVHPDDLGHMLKFNCFRRVEEQRQEVLAAPPILPPVPVVAIPVPDQAQTFIPLPAIPSLTPLPESPVTTAQGNGKLDMDVLKIKDLQDAIFTLEEWHTLLFQEQAKVKPRITVVRMIHKRIRQIEAVGA